MKKILLLSALISTFFTSCLKDNPNNDFSTISPIVELFYYDAAGTAHGGLDNFSKDAIITAGATAPIVIMFNVNFASINPPDHDVTVTLGISDAVRTAYNASHTNQYELMPTTAYTFPVTTGTIKAGTRLANFTVTVDPTKIDPTKNLMLPVTITDAQGNAVSGNFGTVYFHTIGNPLAGNYTVTGTRYNYTGQVSWNNVLPVPANYTATTNLAGTKLASPDNPTVVQIPFANVGAGYNYIITITSPTAISVGYTFNNSAYTVTQYSNIQTTVTYTPGAKPVFRVLTHYNNTPDGTGNDRIIDETFTHQ